MCQGRPFSLLGAALAANVPKLPLLFVGAAVAANPQGLRRVAKHRITPPEPHSALGLRDPLKYHRQPDFRRYIDNLRTIPRVRWSADRGLS